MAASGTGEALRDVERELYALPRDEFIAARTAAARRVAADGDRAAAASVKSLPKPTLLAWAINQAVRELPETAEALLETVSALQHAHDAGELRAGSDRHDQLVHELARAASRHAGGGKAADLAAAIRAAPISADAQRFADGTLSATPRADEDTLAAALALGASLPRPRASKATSASSKRSSSPGRAAATQERRRIRDELSTARAAHREARATTLERERELKALERDLKTARRQLDQATAEESHAAAEVERLQQAQRELRG